jgi:hypothetical protein
VLARENVRLFSVVATASANSLQIVRGGAEESESRSSFWLVSVEVANGSAMLKANVCSSFPSCDAVVCVRESVIGSVNANDQHFSLCYVEAQTGSASVTANETNSWSSCCSLIGCRCDHESCVKGSSQVAGVQVPV